MNLIESMICNMNTQKIHANLIPNQGMGKISIFAFKNNYGVSFF